MLHEARTRVLSAISKDPIFWICLILVVIAFTRCLNGGVAMEYDAEHSEWAIRQASAPFLPGCITGLGYLPFASVVGVTVIIQASRHALGKSARVCFLFAAAFLAAIAAISAALACAFGNEGAIRLAQCSLADPTYAGNAFGLCLMGSMVAIVVSFERKWQRVMPLLLVAVGGSALGLYLFAPDFIVLAYAAGTLVVFLYSLAYAQRRVGGLVIPKCMAFLLISLIPPALFVMGVVPESIKETKFTFLSGGEGVALFSKEFAQMRDILTGVAYKVWKEHPWNGTGLGSFGMDIRFNLVDADWAALKPGQAGALNGWMQMLAERGILGIVFFMVPVVGLVMAWSMRAFLSVRDVISSKYHRFGDLVFHPVCPLGFIAAVLTAACGFFDHSFWRAETVMVVAAMLAMAGSAFPAVKKADEESVTEKK